jgi:hypothetical protein
MAAVLQTQQIPPTISFFFSRGIGSADISADE